MALCTWISLLIIVVGSAGNWLCIGVFFRKRFRSSVLTPFFVSLLVADCLYLTFRVVKLFYYHETLFRQDLLSSSCSGSVIVRLYAYFTQYAPQILVPFFHYELYIRFSLLLMSCLGVQRAYDMCRSSSRLIQRRSSSKSLSFILISCAFLLAYLFEFFSLSVFCSSSLSSEQAWRWHQYLNEHLPNETSHLIEFMKNQSASDHEIECVNPNSTNSCEPSEVAEIVRKRKVNVGNGRFSFHLGHYYDQHQRPIVYLIHRFELATAGRRTSRNELRLKYHYHSCLFRLPAHIFLKLYDLLYARFLQFNRYTIVLGSLRFFLKPWAMSSFSVLGSIVPSLVTIFSNALSLRWIVLIRKSITEQSAMMRKRTDETHRVIFIITIECLLAVFNSWFIDLILSVKFCGGSVAIGDDCPQFLRRFHQYLVFFDLLNSISNIFLYGLAGKRFRCELKNVLRPGCRLMTKAIRIGRNQKRKHVNVQRRETEEEQLFISLEAWRPSRRSTLHFRQIYEGFRMKSMALATNPTGSSGSH